MGKFLNMIEQNFANEDSLVRAFNVRNKFALHEIYVKFVKELNIYSAKLIGVRSMESEDLVEDAFVAVWSSKNNFINILQIKSYLYISIKRAFLRSTERYKLHKNYEESRLIDNRTFTDVFEIELYTILDEAKKFLPAHYLRLLELYIEGRDFDYIVKTMGITKRAAYDIKSDIIKVLRKKCKNNISYILLLIK